MKKKEILYYLAVVLFLFLVLTPIIWCFVISISLEKDIIVRDRIFPESINFRNYRKLLSFSTKEGKSFMMAMKNSLWTSFITVVIGTPIAIITGYSFSRFRNKINRIFSKVFYLTMIIPMFTTIIPLYTLFSKFGILNNNFYLSIIYVSAFIPITTWISVNYFDDFSKEVEEMARIDGCSNLQMFLKIVLPNILPLILTIILIIFLKSWSQYQLPLILAGARETKPLTILIAEFSSKDLVLYSQMATAGIIATIPPTILAFIFRKYLVLGLSKSK